MTFHRPRAETRDVASIGLSEAVTVADLAALKALTSRPESVVVKCKTTIGDGWGGVFYWSAGSVTAADDALVVQPTSGAAGRYLRGPSAIFNELTAPLFSAFVSPAFNLNDLSTAGMSAANSSTHISFARTGNASGAGTGGWQTDNVILYGGAGSDSGSYLTASQNTAYATANAAAGNYTAHGPIVVVVSGASVTSTVGSETNTHLESGATTAAYEGERIADVSPSVGTVTNTAIDAGIFMTKASTARGWTVGLRMDADVTGTDVNFPVMANGTLFTASTTSRTLDYGVDLRGMAGGFNGAAVALPSNIGGARIYFGTSGAGGSIISGTTTGGASLTFGNAVTSIASATDLGTNAANNIRIAGAASAFPSITAKGSTTDVNMLLETQGTGEYFFASSSGGPTQFKVAYTASATRYATVTGSNGGNPTIATTAGSLAITPAVIGASTITGTAFAVGGNQVVGARDTGWTAMTGSADESTAYDTATVTTAQLAGRVMALQAALTTHGLIGA